MKALSDLDKILCEKPSNNQLHHKIESVLSLLPCATELANGTKYTLSSSYPNTEKHGIVTARKPYFFHTDDQVYPSITIDLGEHMRLDYLLIKNRTDVCRERASSLLWQVHSDHAYQKNGVFYNVCIPSNFTDDNESVSVSPLFSAHGRYITVIAPSFTMLHLSEIRIVSLQKLNLNCKELKPRALEWSKLETLRCRKWANSEITEIGLIEADDTTATEFPLDASSQIFRETLMNGEDASEDAFKPTYNIGDLLMMPRLYLENFASGHTSGEFANACSVFFPDTIADIYYRSFSVEELKELLPPQPDRLRDATDKFYERHYSSLESIVERVSTHDSIVIHIRSGDVGIVDSRFVDSIETIVNTHQIKHIYVLMGVHNCWSYVSTIRKIDLNEARIWVFENCLHSIHKLITRLPDPRFIMTGADYSLCIARKSKNLLIHKGGFSSTCSFLCEANIFVTGFYENKNKDSQWRRAIAQHNAKARIIDYCDTSN